MQEAPWDAISSKLDYVIGKLARDWEAASWYTQHLHLYLIHFAIISLCSSQRGATLDDPQRYLYYTSEQLEKFYLEVVAKTHPTEAQLLINDLMLNKLSGARYPTGQVWPTKSTPQVKALHP